MTWCNDTLVSRHTSESPLPALVVFSNYQNILPHISFSLIMLGDLGFVRNEHDGNKKTFLRGD